MNINFPRKLLAEFDAACEGHYANRTVALHEAMRLMIEKLEGKEA